MRANPTRPRGPRRSAGRCRRIASAAAFALIVVACGSDSDETTAARTDEPPAWMSTAYWAGGAIQTIDGAVVVVGGPDDSPAGAETLGRSRRGVIIDADGTYTGFEVDQSLIEVRVSDDRRSVIVSGTVCTTPVEDTDIGPMCGQAGPAVYQIDRATGDTTRILEEELEGAPLESSLPLFAFGDGVAVDISFEDGERRLVHRSVEGTITDLPLPPEPYVECSTGSTLYASLWSEADEITDDIVGTEDPVIGRGAGLVRLRVGDERWQRVDPPDGEFRWAQRHCAKGRFFETRSLRSTTELHLLDADGRWQTVGLDAGEGLDEPWVIAGPWAETFILESFDRQAVVVPSQDGPPTVTVDEVVGDRLDTRSTLITADGQILALNADARLEPVR
jgi:hypothetical protein